MFRLLFLIFTKLGLFAISAFAGMACYFAVKGNSAETASFEVKQAALHSYTYRRETAFDAEPTLLARAESPVDLSGDALGIIYILQRDGKLLRAGDPLANQLATSTSYASLADENTIPGLGFSSIAFHPGFLDKESVGFGKFYVVVAEKPKSGTPDFLPEFGPGIEHHQDVLYEYITPFPLAASFKGSRREVMRFSQPGAENNLGSIVFDQHGHLYLAIGDGAAGKVSNESPSRNASSLTSAYGKVLRIDPTGSNSVSGHYGIPETNPFKMISGALPELWAFGLRAPHSLHFDPFHRMLCIGESAINGTEEINLSALGGEHFGWDLNHGSLFFNLAAKAELDSLVTQPKLSLNRQSGLIGRNTGNVVYRGERFPALAGKLIFASHDGQLLACDPQEGSTPGSPLKVLDLGCLAEKQFAALRTTPMGELVVLCDDGSVYEMRKNHEVGSGKARKRALYCLAERFLGSES